jgi:hypothetical protein
MLNTHMPRPSPCWTSSPTQLPRPSRIHRFSLHLRTVSAITPSYNVKTRCISTRWKEDDDVVDLVLVLAPEVVWIMLCDHDKVLRHLFLGQLGRVSSRALGPSRGRPLLVSHNPRTTLPLHKLSSCRRFRGRLCLEFFCRRTVAVIGCETPTFVC